MDYLIVERICWHGRLGEIQFLSRIYELDSMPSTDYRREFGNAREDIRQHRIRNPDWDDDWIFGDERFRLLKGEDALFLRFLAEMLHPVVRPDPIEVKKIVNALNQRLRVDGFELAETGEISGHPIFEKRSISTAPHPTKNSQLAPEGREGERGGVASFLLSPEEVAVLLKLDLSTVNGLLTAGDLRSVRLGTELRILADDVFQFLGDAMRKQQTELLKARLSDPKAWARQIVKDPLQQKEIEGSDYPAGSFGAFLKSGLMALKAEEVSSNKDKLEDGTDVVVGTPYPSNKPAESSYANTPKAPIIEIDQILISYSHKDTRFLNQLLTHLKPFERAGRLTKWSDQQIAPGSQWFKEIQDAITRTKVTVLLVTPDFLASDFIHEHELGPLLKEAEKGGVRIIWIPVRACAYKETPLRNYQAVISPDNPLAQMKANRDVAWVKICEEIKKAINPSTTRPSGSKT